jgi:Zn-dependent protease
VENDRSHGLDDLGTLQGWSVSIGLAGLIPLTIAPAMDVAGRLRCARCETELAPGAVVCPACRALVHKDTLEQLAANAEARAEAGELVKAREEWQRALALLPVQSQQHGAFRARIVAITRQLDAQPGPGAATAGTGPWWKRGTAAFVAVFVALAAKFKFLLLGLTKAGTLVSMFTFAGLYWTQHGWPLVLGIVGGIYIHEMGHVAVLRRLGIAADAPLFIPGVGALVLLREHVEDPIIDARIGLAGPVWGLAAALAAQAAYLVTDVSLWHAIAQLTALINLFNLIPVWQLDGARGFHALCRAQRTAIVALSMLAFLVTGQKLLVLITGFAVYRTVFAAAGPGDRRAFATFASLVAALAWLARGVAL